MNLNDALICLDCSELFQRSEHSAGKAVRHCPACASRNSFPIAPWLNRTKLEKVFIVRNVGGSLALRDVAKYSPGGRSA